MIGYRWCNTEQSRERKGRRKKKLTTFLKRECECKRYYTVQLEVSGSKEERESEGKASLGTGINCDCMPTCILPTVLRPHCLGRRRIYYGHISGNTHTLRLLMVNICSRLPSVTFTITFSQVAACYAPVLSDLEKR